MERISAAEFKRRYAQKQAEPPAPDAEPAGPQIRLPKQREPNETELRWTAECARRFPGCSVRYEPFSFKLPCGTKYKHDVLVYRGREIVALCEVKGAHIKRDASKEKFKQLLAAWPEWRFIFAQWDGNQWLVADTDALKTQPKARKRKGGQP